MIGHGEETPPPAGDDADLEREIRAGRKFSLSEAIGRMAGGGMMKGASPVARTQQAQFVIEDYLRRHLTDAGGVLATLLRDRVGTSERLLREDGQPLAVLQDCVRRGLESEYVLQELVREADVEWGRLLGERPYFERAGRPPDPADPYTIDSVRAALSQLAARLAAGEP